MKERYVITLVLLLGLVVLGAVQANAQKKSMKEAVALAAGDIKWEEMKGGPPGAKYSLLWGDMTKGGYGAFVKLPAGMKNPLHTHTNTLKLVVLSGTFSYTPEGSQPKLLGPGSYLYEPGGTRHLSGTEATSECVVFQESTGKFDFVPAEPTK